MLRFSEFDFIWYVHIIDTYTLNQVHVIHISISYYFTFEVSDLHSCIKSSTYYTESTSSMFHTIHATIAIAGT